MFELTKWYLDLVTEDGTAIICYSASCRFGSARFRFASLRYAPSDAPATERSALTGVEPPHLEDDSIHWRHDRLDVVGRWSALGAPIHQPLHTSSHGRIEWECLQPHARASARIGGRGHEGLGYVERLRLTLPPWELPFHRLHWGRFVTHEHSLVWIVWDDALAGKWILLDGRPAPDAMLRPDGVDQLPGGQSLRFESGRVICDRAVLSSIGAFLPDALRGRLGPLAGMHERKELAPAALLSPAGGMDLGWALHEEVQW